MQPIYNFDPETGLFLTSDFADESPLEPGVFLVPANSTTDEPPLCKETERVLFKNGGWIVEAIPRPTVKPEMTPEQAKAAAWSGIKAERDRRKAGGVKVGAKWFHSDDGSRIQQMGLVMMGAGIPANLQWKTMDGSFITMTQALATSVFGAVAASDQTVFAAAETHRVAMEASADPASYDYSGGWPKIYGE